MRIVFMGTPEFAVSILQKIHESTHQIVGVVTVMDKPSGRGQIISQSAVKRYAIENKLPLLQPEKLKDHVFIESLARWNADLFVVVAFRMLPELVWKLPPQGTINLHASLLPKYRGAAPINWAIMNGEKETGVTTFFINEKIDTGDILLQEKVSITSNMNAGELHDLLMNIGADLTLKTINLLDNKKIEAIKQGEMMFSQCKEAPKLFKEDCQIQWNLDYIKIHNFIRGLAPYPSAWCTLKNLKLNKIVKFKIFNSIPSPKTINGIKLMDEGIAFPCSNGSIIVSELQPEGKRKMNFKEFLAGNNLVDYEI